MYSCSNTGGNGDRPRNYRAREDVIRRIYEEGLLLQEAGIC